MSRHINLIFEDKVYVGGNSCDGSEETSQPCLKSSVYRKHRKTTIVVVYFRFDNERYLLHLQKPVATAGEENHV
jgi:hypothetical protein